MPDKEPRARTESPMVPSSAAHTSSYGASKVATGVGGFGSRFQEAKAAAGFQGDELNPNIPSGDDTSKKKTKTQDGNAE